VQLKIASRFLSYWFLSCAPVKQKKVSPINDEQGNFISEARVAKKTFSS